MTTFNSYTGYWFAQPAPFHCKSQIKQSYFVGCLTE